MGTDSRKICTEGYYCCDLPYKTGPKREGKGRSTLEVFCYCSDPRKTSPKRAWKIHTEGYSYYDDPYRGIDGPFPGFIASIPSMFSQLCV